MGIDRVAVICERHDRRRYLSISIPDSNGNENPYASIYWSSRFRRVDLLGRLSPCEDVEVREARDRLEPLDMQRTTSAQPLTPSTRSVEKLTGGFTNCLARLSSVSLSY